MTLPTFYIAGAGRSGSTSLEAYCRAHPEIFMPSIKEPNYFIFGHAGFRAGGPQGAHRNRTSIRSLKKYKALFRDAGDAKAIGEGSVSYLAYPEACAGIRELTPHAKLIFILRQPVDRAFSSYQKFSESVPDPAGSFEAAWRDHERRMTENWFTAQYKRKSLYYEQLKVWLDSFDKNQIRIYLYEDLRADPKALMRDLYEFVGVDPSFDPNVSIVHNRRGEIANPILRWTWRNSEDLRSWVAPHLPLSWRGQFFRLIARGERASPGERLDPALRAQLTEEIKDDILKTQDLIGRDLSHWL
ncbi:MAG: hypothetical protein GKS00_17930 [Alphaproteobacteria bacterium]|nr:hypothetical protein [Alphaproteobacteria bacterium]